MRNRCDMPKQAGLTNQTASYSTLRKLSLRHKVLLGKGWSIVCFNRTRSHSIPTSTANGCSTPLAQGREDNGGYEPTYVARSKTRENTDAVTRAAALSRVLGLAQPRLMALVTRCPDLFRFSPEALGATLAAIAELTGLQVFQVPQLISVDPELLLQPDRLKSNMRGLAQALGVPAREVVMMGAREPSILALSGFQAEQRLDALHRMLGLNAGQYGELVAALLRNPGTLLVPEPSALEGQLQSLESSLEAVLGEDEEGSYDDGEGGLRNEDLPWIHRVESYPATAGGTPSSHRSDEHVTSPAPTAPTMKATKTPSLPLRHRVGALVLAKPVLLSTPPQILAGRLVHLAVKAHVTPTQVLAAAISGPDLLAASSCFIDRHCTAVASALSHAGGCSGGDWEAAAILISEPRLLEQNVGSLSAKWLMLMSVFRSAGGSSIDSRSVGGGSDGGGNSKWEHRLSNATVSERAALMVLQHSRLARLRFLADASLQDHVDPFEVLQRSEAMFETQYPAFRQWQAG